MMRDPDLAELRALREGDGFLWLDLHDPSAEALDSVARVFGWHELAVEDTKKFGQRSKLDVYGDQQLLVYFGTTEGADGVPEPVEVHLHIGASFVVTVHREECREFEHTRHVMEREPAETESMLVYRVIDALTDSTLDVLERVSARVESYEALVFHRPRARDRDQMAMLRRGLGRIRRVLVSQRQVFERTMERLDTLSGFSPDLITYYRDVGDHLWRALDETEAARESLQGMLDTYANEVQERLTIVATIFLPLTVVTGFFGQNFTWMINHIGAAWAFWGLGVGGLIVSGLGIAAWLARSGLYQRGGG